MGCPMKVYEYCMFHNEHAVLDIKLRESRGWVDELHLCEANCTFQGERREPVLPAPDDFLKCHLFDGEARFHPPLKWGPSRHWPFFRRRKMARKNETMQRNAVHRILGAVNDDDIVVLSDIDEILDSRHAGEVIDAARRHGIVSVRLHHTLYYLNLYSTNWHEVWPGSPPDYAYRLFVMTGARFRKLAQGSDRLRRRGEWGQLNRKVHLLDGFRGFHHSWLGDEAAALAKLRSYAHSADEHRADLLDEAGNISAGKLRDCIRSGQSLFPGNRLEVRGFDEVEPLVTVRNGTARYSGLLL